MTQMKFDGALLWRWELKYVKIDIFQNLFKNKEKQMPNSTILKTAFWVSLTSFRHFESLVTKQN